MNHYYFGTYIRSITEHNFGETFLLCMCRIIDKLIFPASSHWSLIFKFSLGFLSLSWLSLSFRYFYLLPFFSCIFWALLVFWFFFFYNLGFQTIFLYYMLFSLLSTLLKWIGTFICCPFKEICSTFFFFYTSSVLTHTHICMLLLLQLQLLCFSRVQLCATP